MSDDGVGVVLVFVEEIAYARECNLIDVFVNLFLCHTYSVVAYSQCLCLLVEAHVYGYVAQFAFEIAFLCESLYFLSGVDGVAHHLAQEDFMV